MANKNPKVTIGMPVYNGENYIAEAIDSILGQTFPDFELIVSDNASTDGTAKIVHEYMERDPRVRYVHNDINVGAAKNYNLLVPLARGEYFKWAAHDDRLAPTFLERCVEILEQDSKYVVAYARVIEMDADGNELQRDQPIVEIDATRPYRRFAAHVCRRGIHQNTVFGVIRLETLRQTRLIGAFSSSDRVLNGELALRGAFYEIPEYLFYKRNHAQAHWKVYTSRRAKEAWYDPHRAGKRTFPTWRLLREHFQSIALAPIGRRERLFCRIYMIRWVRYNWRALTGLRRRARIIPQT